MESHPRRRLHWSGRQEGKNLVRVQCIWRFRYGPPTHVKGLHRTVCIIFSYLAYASILRHPCNPAIRTILALYLYRLTFTPECLSTFHFMLTFFFPNPWSWLHFLVLSFHGSLDGLRTLKESSKKVFRWVWMMNLIDGRSTPMDVTSECLIYPSTSIHDNVFRKPILC